MESGDEYVLESEVTETPQSGQQSVTTEIIQNDHLYPACAKLQTTYRLCGDNIIDKTIRPRYMRCDSGKTNSIHLFHVYAVSDRINVNTLTECTFPFPSISEDQLAVSLLPSIDDDYALYEITLLHWFQVSSSTISTFSS